MQDYALTPLVAYRPGHRFRVADLLGAEPGKCGGLMSRGNQGRDIFADDQDRRLFPRTLSEGCGKTGWQIHARVLMGNHYHLLLKHYRNPSPQELDEAVTCIDSLVMQAGA